MERYCEKYENYDSKQINESTSSSKPEISQQCKKDKPSSNKASVRKTAKPKTFPEYNALSNTKRQVEGGLNEVFIDNTNDSTSKNAKEDAVKKRKRQTQFDQSYHCYTDVTEDVHQKRKKSSIESDAQPLKNDISVDVNSNVVDSCNKSSIMLEQTTFNYDKLDSPYLDDIDNASEIIEPRSPTLLLKRSQNNKWHIAKAVVPQINIDSSESELVSGMAKKIESRKNSGSKLEMEKVKGKLKFPQTSSNTKSKEPSVKRLDDSAHPLPAVNKLSKKDVKKVNDLSKRKKSSGTTTCVDEKKLERNTNSEKGVTDIKPCTNGSKSVSVENINLDERNPSTDIVKKKTLVENKEKQENTTKKDKVVKKKRKRRIEINNFRLVETIPYPSLLMVKDGDLCPSYTMVYNNKNYLPGCCHALWRWRLGKPLKIPGRSPSKTKIEKAPVEKVLDDACEETTKEDEQYLAEAKPDESPKFENTSEEEPEMNKAKSETSSCHRKSRRASF